MYWYHLEKIDLGHHWDLGLKRNGCQEWTWIETAKIDQKIMGVVSPMQFALYLLHNSKEVLLHSSRQRR